MEPSHHDQQFEALMTDLVSLHGELSRIRSLERSAEDCLGQGLALADSVRRAVRRGTKHGPDLDDCRGLAAIVGRLEELVRSVESSEPQVALRAALNAGDLELTARLACELFTALELADPAPVFGYRAISIRRRQRGAGETLLHPETAARAIADQVSAGFRPPSTPQAETPELSATPRPIILASSLDTCTSEIALRVARGDIGAPLLRHTLSGDIWVFAPRIGGPFSVAIAAEADDEWWAASPIRYASYVDDLRAALTRLGITTHVEQAATEGRVRG